MEKKGIVLISLMLSCVYYWQPRLHLHIWLLWGTGLIYFVLRLF